MATRKNDRFCVSMFRLGGERPPDFLTPLQRDGLSRRWRCTDATYATVRPREGQPQSQRPESAWFVVVGLLPCCGPHILFLYNGQRHVALLSRPCGPISRNGGSNEMLKTGCFYKVLWFGGFLCLLP